MRTIFTTARLTLREMTADDLDFIAEMLGDSEVMRFYPKCYSRTEAEAWLSRQLERYHRDAHGLWLAVHTASAQPIGQIGLTIQQVDGLDEPEIGYLVHRPFWRQGYAAEAAAGTRDHAFNVLQRRRVISLIRPVNLPSQAVARKIGMTPEKRTLHAGLEHIVFALRR